MADIPIPKPGDIVGFSGTRLPSVLINLGTWGIPFWSISHVGIIGEYHGDRLLFEADAFPSLPCVIQGKPFRGTIAVHLGDRLAGYQGKAWLYPICRPLYAFEQDRLNQFLLDHLGIPYDNVGAVRSAGVGFSWFEQIVFGEEDLSYIFCSEYAAAAHREIGLLRTDNINRFNPNRLIRVERQKRILLRPWRLPCEGSS